MKNILIWLMVFIAIVALNAATDTQTSTEGVSIENGVRTEREIPQTINFQAAVKDADGMPVNDTRIIEFRIYSALTGGTALWSEILYNVEITDGIFSEALGDATAFPEGLFDNLELFITFVMGGEEMSPRQKLLAVPYALEAQNAQNASTADFALYSDEAMSVGGLTSTDIVFQDLNGDASVMGTMTANAFVGDGSGLTNLSAMDDDYINAVGPDLMTANSDTAVLSIENEGMGDAINIPNSNSDGIVMDFVLDKGIHMLDVYDGVVITSADDNGIEITAADDDGIYIGSVGTPSTQQNSVGANGLEIAGTEGYGVYVGRSDATGVYVNSTGSSGVTVGTAEADGMYVYNAGNPSTQTMNAYSNGFEIAGAEGSGLYVGRADASGIYLNSTGYSGITVSEAGTDGMFVYHAGTPSTQQSSSSNNGLEIAGAEGYGVFVGRADASGVYVNSSGDDGVYVNNTTDDGFGIYNAGDDGLAVSYATDDGVFVNSAGDVGINVTFAGTDGMFVYHAGSPTTQQTSTSKNGFEIAGAEGNGLYVGQADLDGVSINSATDDGVYVGTVGDKGFTVDSTGDAGFYVYSAGEDGVKVYNAGTPSTQTSSTAKNGFEVAGAEGYGLYVGRADIDGVVVNSVGDDGIVVVNAGDNGIAIGTTTTRGVRVTTAGTDGFYVLSAGNNGVDVRGENNGVSAYTNDASDEWGLFTSDKIYGSNVTLRSQSTHVRNTGAESLEAGDIVCISGYEDNTLSDGNTLVRVEKANSQNSSAVFGVVEYRVTIEEEADERNEGRTLKSFAHEDGRIGSGDYLSVIVFGPADVKADGRSNIKSGEKLTVSDSSGKTRNINESDNWTIGILGKALENSNGKDTVKVFVNCK